MRFLYCFTLSILLLWAACSTQQYDIIIRNGTVIDGSGKKGFNADVAIRDGRIAKIAKDIPGKAKQIIDAEGSVVSPGFIDMLSWACGPIWYDGTVPSVVRQGITTAVLGEGWSMGPVNENVKKEMAGWWQEYEIPYDWQTLDDYLRLIEQRGTSVNIASCVGATTLRMYVIGFEDRRATPAELQQMKDLLRREMEAGALGLASSLVYTPAFYADTHELIDLAKVAAEYDGVYASHIRGEGSDLLKALDEFITICEQANIRGEIYHLKAAGKENWPLLEKAIAKIEAARQRGLRIYADIYPYTAGATGLDATLPPWAKEGGDEALVKRLQNKKLRGSIKKEILTSFEGWENFYRMAGGGKGILISYLSEKNQELQGKYLSEAATQRGYSDELEFLFDLLIEENGGGGGIYFLMPEENVVRKIQLPWVSFDTDEDAYRPTGPMSKRHPHPRAYGTFPRILGKYVREEKVIPLEEAIRKMTSLAAKVARLSDRGLLQPGKAADVVVFNPKTVTDHATYTEPHRFATGIEYVLVNGRIVVEKEQHTGAKPGRVLRKTP